MGKKRAPNGPGGPAPLRKKERRHREEGHKNGDADPRPNLVDLSGDPPSRVVPPDGKPSNDMPVRNLSRALTLQGTSAKKLPFVFDLTVDTPPLVAAAPPPKGDNDSSDDDDDGSGIFTLDKFPDGKSDPNERHDESGPPLDRALALDLEREYEKESKLEMERNEALARRMLTELQDGELENEHDEEIARELQTKLHQEEKAAEEREMVSTHSGKAWKFVEKVLELHKQLQGGTLDSKLDPVAVDAMVFLAEAMLKTQEEFSQAGKPVHVDIGYHYTRQENMTRIKTNGLLTKAERDTRGITSNHNGSSMGDGVYTANDPVYSQVFGDVGLVVARLQGVTHGRAGNHDTVSDGQAVVLRKSSQCLALIEYSTSFLGLRGREIIDKYHSQLQKIVDELFNGGVTTEVPKLPTQSDFPWVPPSLMAGVNARRAIAAKAGRRGVPIKFAERRRPAKSRPPKNTNKRNRRPVDNGLNTTGSTWASVRRSQWPRRPRTLTLDDEF